MTDGERLWTGIALSLFLHFTLLLCDAPEPEQAPLFRAVLDMDEESTLSQSGARQGTGIQSSSAQDREEAEKLDRKRRAYLRYLDDVDDAIHARRLDFGETSLIGVALCAFTIAPDGTFSDARIVTGSGRPELDASALRAVRAASGVVPRLFSARRNERYARRRRNSAPAASVAAPAAAKATIPSVAGSPVWGHPFLSAPSAALALVPEPPRLPSV